MFSKQTKNKGYKLTSEKAKKKQSQVQGEPKDKNQILHFSKSLEKAFRLCELNVDNFLIKNTVLNLRRRRLNH